MIVPRAARRIAVRAGISAVVKIGALARPWAKRGPSARWQIARCDSHPCRARWRPKRRRSARFDKPRFDKDRDDAAGRANVRVFRGRATIVPNVPPVRIAARANSTVRARTVRIVSVRDSIVRVRIAPRASALRIAMNGRNIRAMRRGTARAATTRTTARSLPNVPLSVAVGPIVSDHVTTIAARRALFRKRRKPASASPRSSRAPGFARAAMLKSGSCRAACP